MELLLTLTHCLKRINKALQFLINRVLNEQKKGFNESLSCGCSKKERIEEGLGRMFTYLLILHGLSQHESCSYIIERVCRTVST